MVKKDQRETRRITKDEFENFRTVLIFQVAPS